ncbi:MAG TPA: ABC transporter substrate-binding protein [Acidimicrobiales bacterium]|nr:ABC transporter substrate-binding protein [Acidimicrobiales bacterium]
MSKHKLLAALTALALGLAACGSNGAKTSVKQGYPGQGSPGQAGATTSTTGAAPGVQSASGNGNTLSATSNGSGSSGGGVYAGNGNTSGGPPASIGTPSGFRYTPASLFSGPANTQGITSSTITLCMHAATVFGNVFNERPQDIGVYWNWLNANGGVIGRKVNLTIEDDAYTPQGAQQAAQQCEALNPFFVIGGIGFDQDPVVRQIAEQDHFIYIYTMADQGTGKYNYSFTGSPTIQQDGTWNAQALIDNHYPGPYGAVYVNDAAWLGGWTTFKSYMDAHGGSSVDKNAYTTNSGGDTSGFQAYITQLKLAGVKTVYLWMNALAADAFVEQAANQGYYPAYVTPDGFNLVTQTVGQNIDDKSPAIKPAMGVWITPAFDPNNHNVAWWPQEKAMLDAYAQYDSGHTPDDIDWMAWLAFQQITDLLNTCGTTCNKNDIAGIFHSGWQDTRYPLCPVDFRNNPNFGGVSANLFVATREGNQTVWRQPVSCASKF